MEDMLVVKNVSKKLGDFYLNDVSLSLPKGYIMGYIGKNGAGKTTTINIINHLINPDCGSVTINGISYKDNPVLYKEQIGYVGDESYFPPEFKIKDVKKVLKMFYKSFDEKKFDEIVEREGLSKDKKIKDFSRGMNVKLMFATVLSRETKILILDEATNGLDPIAKDSLMTTLQEYIEDGEKSIFFSTHVVSDLEQIADFVVMIENGKLVINEQKEELLENYLIVKGNESELKGLEGNLLGKKSNDYGFEAMIKADCADEFGNKFIFEKPNIEQIAIHLLRA
ncbi:ABC-2 type transport system ATP-binding protein [Acetitomaculum ruminis DSM 5522]|uniref:ABC-2 type transport system ATP-binding protein n=1 Tax=Acetitomaculum ruminis DSM 5522 TaxID=1120918 RepID=A0A1I0Z7L9_9FIRM|nr:ABC transporter ATP-binding protein [Acetitomaculum ruminis]SFB21614.1 ABC-2 type transport system ATP-binding protein [Acetitomaculum ruminis DSM 5522]